MDYLDLKKQARHRVILLVGYVLVAVAIVIATLVLLYQAYGFGLGKNGTVIQNGLLFLSSHPNPAAIYIDNVKKSQSTNTRMVVNEGVYGVKLAREGYRDWQRRIEVDGGNVKHFDYPFLFPKELTTKKVQAYDGAPGLMSQSPDRRWLLIQPPGAVTNFDVYDLRAISKPSTTISLPPNVITQGSAGQAFKLAEWADDNKHVVLQHDYDGKTEFILLDRGSPEQSINLNNTLSISPTKLTLRDKKYDQYYVYNAGTLELQTVSLKDTAVKPLLARVLAYQSYGEDSLLYVTDAEAPAGSALAKLRGGKKTVNIRNLPASPAYLVDLTKYSGDMYVAVGASAGEKVYVFKDPFGQRAKQPRRAVVPSQVLHVPQPNYLGFSASAQFIVAENGDHFGIYDIENETGYNYVSPQALDSPQAHASWMDGNRLTLVSGGKLEVFDYDDANQQALMPASSLYLPAFTPDYKNVYSLAANPVTGQLDLTQTSLLTPADR